MYAIRSYYAIDHVPNLWSRLEALESLKTKPGFEPLAVAFKRVVNISYNFV